jgi:hypothetical protein
MGSALLSHPFVDSSRPIRHSFNTNSTARHCNVRYQSVKQGSAGLLASGQQLVIGFDIKGALTPCIKVRMLLLGFFCSRTTKYIIRYLFEQRGPAQLLHRIYAAMLNVLIIGPTGYVGFSAFGHLFRAGSHKVFGLAETKSEGYHLAAKEIIPIVGKVTNKESVLDVVRRENIHIIIDTSSFNDIKIKPTIFSAVVSAGRQILSEHTKKRPAKKLGFITLTGIWSHGSSEDPGCTFHLGKEGSLLTDPPVGLVEAREEYEDSVLGAKDVLDVSIIRPAFIFGRGGAAWTRFLAPLVQAKESQPENIDVSITPGTFGNFINIDDVGNAVEKAVNRLHWISGTSVDPIFEISSDRFDLHDLLVADAKIFGCKGSVAQHKSDDNTGKDGGDEFLRRIGISDTMDSSKARNVLNWSPKKSGFVAGTHVYANSYLASLEIAKEERQKWKRPGNE